MDTTNKVIKISVLYNSFTFIATRRKFPIYKKELYAIVVFITKYDYLYKYPYLLVTIYTDYRPLTQFLSLDI